MIRSRNILSCLLVYFLAVVPSLSAQKDLPCAAMALATPFDQLMENGHSLLSGYRPEDCACFGEYFAKKHIEQGNFALLDSEWVPIFELKGYSLCRLTEFKFGYKLIPDLFLPADDRPKVRAYVERYNALMLYELKEIAGENSYRQIFKPPEHLDPYMLKERLQTLARFGELTKNDWVDERTLQVRIDLGPLYRNLNFNWKDLRFEIVDENKPGGSYFLSLEELSREGFPLAINSESRKSNVWFDFKIRIDFSQLAVNNTLVSCERIDEFVRRFEHLSLTRDLKIISHLH